MSEFVLIKNKRKSYPGFPLLVLFGIAGSKAGSMITVLASFTLQQWLRKEEVQWLPGQKQNWPGLEYSDCTLECLLFLPHTRQNLHRRQHQFSLFSSEGRSAGSRQNGWKGSQHTWQNSICKMAKWKRFHFHCTVSLTFDEFINNSYLVLTFTGTKVANVGWHERGGGQYA